MQCFLKRGTIILLTFSIIATHSEKLLGQLAVRKNIDLEKFIQEFFPQQDENLNYEDLYESLYQNYISPINLGTASRETLQNLHILSEKQLTEYTKHIKRNGPLISIYELQAVPGFDLATIEKLLPFVKLEKKGNPTSRKEIVKELRENESNYLLLRYSRVLELKKGFENKKYEGSPDKVYLRLRSSTSKKNSIGLTLEKDAGEKLSWGPSKKMYGADFFSFHFALYNRNNLKSLVIGDYQMQLGQGLLLGAGFKFGKGAETVSMVKRNNLGIRPNTSVMESGFFRGIAFSYEIFKAAQFTFFYSGKRVDGNLELEDSSDISFGSLSTFGYHRTALEIENKNTIQERIAGGNLSISLLKKNLHIGLTGLGTIYNLDYLKPDHLYNLFEFAGKENKGYGVDVSWLYKNFNFFGEGAMSQNGNTGLIAGFVSSLSRQVDFSFVVRNYEKEFHSFYGKAFGENSRNINETGLYWGIKISPIPKWSIAAYYDSFRFPWVKYRVDGPSEGNETMFRLAYTPAKKIQLYIQCKMQEKVGNQNKVASSIHLLGPNRKINYLINLDYTVSPNLSFKSRIQLSNFRTNQTNTAGYCMYQEVNLDFRRLSIDLRFAVFDTDDYDNRQFTFERDVKNAFSMPQLYGNGTRAYAVIKFKCSSNIELSGKISSTSYDNVKYVGSGLEQIRGNKVNEVKLQLIYKF